MTKMDLRQFGIQAANWYLIDQSKTLTSFSNYFIKTCEVSSRTTRQSKNCTELEQATKIL